MIQKERLIIHPDDHMCFKTKEGGSLNCLYYRVKGLVYPLLLKGNR